MQLLFLFHLCNNDPRLVTALMCDDDDDGIDDDDDDDDTIVVNDRNKRKYELHIPKLFNLFIFYIYILFFEM